MEDYADSIKEEVMEEIKKVILSKSKQAELPPVIEDSVVP